MSHGWSAILIPVLMMEEVIQLSVGLFGTWNPDDILYYTKNIFLTTENKDRKFVSINVLESSSVIIKYASALTVIESTNFTNDPWSVLLAMCDNISTVH